MARGLSGLPVQKHKAKVLQIFSACAIVQTHHWATMENDATALPWKAGSATRGLAQVC